MSNFKLVVHKKAQKELEKLPITTQKQVAKAIDLLEINPRPNGYKKLTGFKSEPTTIKECYRIRFGDYRIIYTIEQDIISIPVV